MNYEFLTSQHGFSNTSQDGALSIGAKTSARKTDIVYTERSKTEKSDQSFADYLKSQKDSAEKNKKKDDVQTASEDKAASSDVADKQQSENVAPMQVLKADEADVDDYVLNLTEFGNYLRDLIQNIDQQDNAEQNDAVLIEVDNVLESDVPALDKISALLGLFNLKDENGEGLSNEDQMTSLLRLVDVISADQATLSGLSIEDITTLEKHVTHFLSGRLEQDDADELNSIIAQFVVLAAPPSEKRSQGENSADISARAKPELEPAIRAQTQINLATQNSSTSHSDARYDARYDIAPQGDNRHSHKTERTDFNDALKAVSQGQTNNSADVAKPGPKNATAAERFLLNAPFASVLNSFGGSAESPLISSSFVQQSSTALSSSFSNVTTQAPSASQTHPATQMVSLTIVKAAKAGEKADIKLHLNPPELGRVDVKMSIDKDSKAKIVLTVEKPETYLMLQRDADALHRALNDAGVDSQGDIAFELADDGNNTFSGRGGDNSGQNNGRGGTSDETDLIETTMDWHVDPESGRMRYNILV